MSTFGRTFTFRLRECSATLDKDLIVTVHCCEIKENMAEEAIPPTLRPRWG